MENLKTMSGLLNSDEKQNKVDELQQKIQAKANEITLLENDGSNLLKDFDMSVFNEKYNDALCKPHIYNTCNDIEYDMIGITQDLIYKYESDFYNGNISADQIKNDIEILKKGMRLTDEFHDLVLELLLLDKYSFYNVYLLVSAICRSYNDSTIALITNLLRLLN